MAIFVNTTQPRKFLEGHEFVQFDAMRGLHFLRPSFPQSKLVRCVKGRVIIIPSFFVDKASCTRQFESKLSLHSLASLFPIKEGSTSHLGLLPSGKKRETALLGAQNRYALRLAGHQSPRHILRDGTALLQLAEVGNSSLQFTVNSLQFTIDFVVIC